MSLFTDAERNRREIDLVCPRCGEVNRPGVFNVRFEQDGSASCKTCGHGFTPAKELR